MSTEEGVRFQLEVVADWLENGRQAFERLVAHRGSSLAKELWALKEDELRAIVFERVVAVRDHGVTFQTAIKPRDS